MKYPSVYKAYSGDDSITDDSGKQVGTVLDYWKWAHSFLLDNA